MPSESTKHVNPPWIQISLIPTFLTLARFKLQNIANEYAIYLKRNSDMEVERKKKKHVSKALNMILSSLTYMISTKELFF